MIRLADDTTTTTADQPFWEWFASFWAEALFIVVVVLVAAGLHFLGSRLIHRSVEKWITSGRSREDALTDTPEATVELQSMIMGQRREQRAKAVGQLLRSALVLVVWGTAGLLILTELGVNVAPLIASAGVVGVALGFGAQTLVKDYLSGFFMIVEDQYGVGDLVDVGPVTGTVEEVALRVTRIRDPTGVVWYVRNGEILRVANQSQGWVLAAVDIPVAYDENLDTVRRCIEAVAEDMYADPQYDDMLLGKPTYAGVESVSGEAVFIKVIAKAAPEKQIPLTRAIRARVKESFDRAGVRVPVVVRPFPPGAGGAQPPK